MNLHDFSSIDDFKNFVQGLTPTEIQKWSTRDWLDVYEKISSLCRSLKPYIDYREFVNKSCEEEFTKLYKNYRFDPEEFQIVRKMANITGQNLAAQGKIDLANLLENGEQIYSQMKTVIDTVKEVSQMPHNIEFKDEWGDPFEGTRGLANYYHISIFRNLLKDDALMVTSHEAAHSLLQRDDCQIGRKQDYTKRELAHSYEFSKLMDYNHLFYLNSSTAGEAFDGYKHQPIEKHANFFGYFCERSFRANAGQLTERCAIKLLAILNKPLKAYYENKDIVMEYALDDMHKIKALSAISPTGCLQYEQKNSTVCLKVKSNFKLNNFLRKLQNRDFEIGKDISFQQYLDYPLLSDYISIPQRTEFPQKADFSRHTSVNLTNINCDKCAEIILPQNKKMDEWYWNMIANTVLPAKLACNKSNVLFKNCDFSKVKEITGYKSVLAIRESTFPNHFDFSEVNSIKFENVDLSSLEDVKWPHKIASLEGCKLPEDVDFSNVKSVNLRGADLSETKNIKLPDDLDNIVIPKEMLTKYPVLKTAVTVVQEMKKIKDRYAKKTTNKSTGKQCIQQNIQKTR